MRSTWAEQAWAVLRKDVTLEVRGRVTANAMLFFAVIVLLIFSFALGPDPRRLGAAASGLLWLAFVFAGVLAFGRIYQLEAENNAFEGLLLVARSRSAIYAGKLAGAALIMLAIELVVTPLMALLYNLRPAGSPLMLALVLVLGTVGFASVGALYGALTMSLRAREVLLPVLLLPVTAPVILAAVKATATTLGSAHTDLALWLEVLVGFDLIFITAGMMTFEYAVGE